MQYGNIRPIDPVEFDDAQAEGLFAGKPTAKYVCVAVLALLALLCIFPLTAHFSSPETYAGTIESLDAKKTTVMELVATSTAASGAITLLPGDAGTPIAEKLVDLSSDFLVVLAAIYLEKYLLTTLGFAAFRILIPIGCVLGIAALLVSNERWSAACRQLACKLALFGIATALLVPASVFVSNMIESTYQESIDQTIAAAQQSTEDLEAAAQESPDSDEALPNDETEGQASPQGLGGVVSGLINQGENLVSSLSVDAQQALSNLQDALNHYVEVLAMMIVTSCIIPILVLLFFLWLTKTILGVNIEIPAGALKPRTFMRHR